MYVSRGGDKLKLAIEHWNIDVGGLVCADLGCNVGGFTDFLLKNGAKKVYAVDTAYGSLDYKLRIDERVVVMERNNALRVELPEKVDLVVIDVGWTRQIKVLPEALKLIKKEGELLSLLKPQYEAGKLAKFIKGKRVIDNPKEILDKTIEELTSNKIKIADYFECPVRGGSGNTEYFLRIKNN